MVSFFRDHLPAILAACLLLNAVCIGLWDIYCTYGPGSQYTVSALLADWSRQWPVLPFALGMLAGHIFWGRWPSPPQNG
jgi:hypothetical protein